MTLEEMRSVDVRTVDRDQLVDVTRIRIDEGLPKEERVREAAGRRSQVQQKEGGRTGKVQ